MVQLYIKYIDDNYYLLDIEENESINLKQTYKDLNDITKIFAPFTQSFNLPATDKNKRLCGYVGNEKIQRINNNGKFEVLVYIGGFIYDSGILSFDETDYVLKEQKSFKTNYASNLTGLSEILGTLTIQDLFLDSNGVSDDLLKINWDVVTAKNMLESITTRTLANGIELKYGIPFISNNRVWNYDPVNLGVIDNIAFNPVVTIDGVNRANLNEIRPAVSYMTIMKHLLLRIGVPINCPLFEEPELKDAFVLCNSEKVLIPEKNGYKLVNYTPITTSFEVIFATYYPVPTPPKWNVTGGLLNGVFKIKRNNLVSLPNDWVNLKINLIFDGLIPVISGTPQIKVNLINNVTGIILNTQVVDNGNYTFSLIDQSPAYTMLDNNGELYLRFEILPLNLVSWSNIRTSVNQKLYKPGQYNVDYNYLSENHTSPSVVGATKFSLIDTLPKMKCVDFLKSFFKTFNISVLSTGLNDQSMYWLTPENIKEINKPYSKRIVDYTPYIDTEKVNKKRGNEYNQYSFTHNKSKYYDGQYGDGTYFGALTYPLIPPTKVNKFEVATNYSILKQNDYFFHPSMVKTCLAFQKDSPTILPIGAYRYKPVYEEFTLMYLKPVSLGTNKLGFELNATQNVALNNVLESSFKNYTNGKTLAFGAEGLDTNSLYLNYYDDFIELLLHPNTYKSEFEINLPVNEIFLNYSNLLPGESNIPTGFRLQNEIIIGEQRYFLLDSQIDLTTGKGKLTALNF